MRILIGTVEIAGIGSNLQAGFEQIGITAQTVLSEPHPFNYDAKQSTPSIVRGWQWIGATCANLRRDGSGAAPFVKRLHQFYSLFVLAWALARFDACIFLFGQAITGLKLELRLWRWLGKKVIFVYVGSDTRPPYISGARFPPSRDIQPDEVAGLSHHVKARVELQEKFADYCVNSPFSGHFHTKPFINWFALGIPSRANSDENSAPRRRQSQVRILHAPSRVEAKGSSRVRELIHKLESSGLAIEYIEITNQPNAVVLAELRRCDFIVDQVYSDTPMAGLAAEAAAAGKPAVVGGYAADLFAAYVSRDDTPPSLFVHPDELEEAIRKMVVDTDFRRQLGRKAFDFVTRRWSTAAIAARYMRLLNDDVPDSWYCDPARILYVKGAALSEDHGRRLVASIIDRYGTESLQVSDKPELEKAFITFAGLDSGHRTD
jgi:glycosyltransferase involved in cell wall biosynthesis